MTQLRFQGFLDWKVTGIIGALPLALHASLGLFMVGLSLYVSQLEHSLSWIVVGITALSFLMYFGSILISATTIQCPYRISLMFKPMQLLLYLLKIVAYCWQRLLHHLFCSCLPKPAWPPPAPRSYRDAEIIYLKAGFNIVWSERRYPLPSFKQHHSILAHSLRWLQTGRWGWNL
jgi:hypothetical protein